MKKNIFITLIILIVIIICAIAYYYFNKPTVKTNIVPDNSSNIAQNANVSVASGVQKTNPFDVNVNPYQGYKNPFK